MKYVAGFALERTHMKSYLKLISHECNSLWNYTIPVLTHNGASARNDIDKAKMLNEFFKQCFNTTMPRLDQPATQTQFNGECPTELLCTEAEVLKMLQSLDTTKSNGPDGISARMLKSTAHSITPSVTKLFNNSWHVP